MGDSGEGLIDAEARIQERMEELQQERIQNNKGPIRKNAEAHRELESLRLARTQLQGQLNGTTHEARKAQLMHALDEIDRRMSEARTKI